MVKPIGPDTFQAFEEPHFRTLQFLLRQVLSAMPRLLAAEGANKKAFQPGPIRIQLA
jgi:hypothetical protein